jgi:hypothetical protein
MGPSAQSRRSRRRARPRQTRPCRGAGTGQQRAGCVYHRTAGGAVQLAPGRHHFVQGGGGWGAPPWGAGLPAAPPRWRSPRECSPGRPPGSQHTRIRPMQHQELLFAGRGEVFPCGGNPVTSPESSCISPRAASPTFQLRRRAISIISQARPTTHTTDAFPSMAPTCAACSAQAAVFCAADNAWFCGTCDKASHAGPLASQHRR